MNRKRFLMLLRGLGFAALVTTGTGQTQTPAPDAKPAVRRTLRLLPLGEPPPFRQEIRDGIRFELEPPAGSIPPRQVLLGEGEAAVPLRLHLGRTSERAAIDAGVAPLVLQVPGNGAGVSPPARWLSLVPPLEGDALAVVWRNPGDSWAKPRALVLSDSAAAFPAGSVRLVNLLPVEAALVLGGEKIRLEAGKSLVRVLPMGNDHTLQVGYRDADGTLRRFYAGAVLLHSRERAHVLIYRADGERPRQPAKVLVFNETAPVAPPP